MDAGPVALVEGALPVTQELDPLLDVLGDVPLASEPARREVRFEPLAELTSERVVIVVVTEVNV